MKLIFSRTVLLMVLLLLGACGKKTQEENNMNAHRYSDPVSDLKFAWKEVQIALDNGDLQALQLMIESHPNLDLEQYTNNGDTLLILAIRNGDHSIRNYLLEIGVNAQKPNIDQYTPLMIATLKGDDDSVKLLLELKVQLNKKDAQGNTALHHAIKEKREGIAKILIKHGASVEEADGYGKNSFVLAAESKNLKVLELIRNILKVKYGTPDIATFREAILSGDIHRMHSILTRYPDIVRQYEMINPLALALEIPEEREAIAAATLFLTYGANINGPKESDFTPLIRAVQLNKVTLFERFLEQGANPNLTDKDGKSALIHAVELNRTEMVWELLYYDAEKSYTLTTDDNELTFHACQYARQASKDLQTVEEKNKNREIRSALGCRLWRSWFLLQTEYQKQE